MENTTPVPDQGWIKLVDAALFLGIYPGTLYRRWRYRQLPEGACKKVGNTLYFRRSILESMLEVGS